MKNNSKTGAVWVRASPAQPSPRNPCIRGLEPIVAEYTRNQSFKFDMGKVHGSLARAGKVRGQTPKVAKQDKKKQPRGRAHKRIQYNRRFVTAVVGFGKKRGPNSSEK
ncbi:Ribosomal protein S30 [Cynara cardunculus var. scolymus]|uniref:Ribosomal protein S30 n=1 Tax=Cynara cardunculus var. scolymus TaxID=59895 RepID=A0A103Y2C1_CYNCS|nr:Ribosomal protein S30 [Cynara cardunculus var. scolymus]